ncbi:sulfatase-like hydrolase/transferase [Saccharopolyspora sp. K220]|uniref:sulfatase-like hydrolase/transferase n=1 Tax=Saccharopolyspora soli TaxID=2926618 RepID=UPI001F562A3B|nr:sulfatase-like hydrolase/transferase [Saccharopolyspora soli]MCI2417498.1 sulfatase-like hydrolase/transferase [Saccharopolyspora soli]
MRAIMLMFDTLNRRFLPPYGATGVHAPNFTRLSERSATFDTCYGGSMPCIPARREIHTGRHNFLHRSWGPLEPFDDSVPEILSRQGIYTHLVTDHQHYWEDGGATYHNRYRTYEFFRGQEGDRWQGHVADPDIPDTISWRSGATWRQDWINRQYLRDPADHPQTRTVDAGLKFLATNRDERNWFLQIECFDPHEPFFTYDEHRAHYVHDYAGEHYDWPDYRKVAEDEHAVRRVRSEYCALLTMCDASLGRVLDAMDRYEMWDDTMLVVCTDHGLLLGEHGWWGKNVQPWYDENIHTPLFIWDPRSGVRGQRRASLVQTVDFGPTLLDFFGVPIPELMRGRPLSDTVATDAPVREAGLFGMFGGHVNVTDGRYVYMRAPATQANQPLFEHTLMPTHMASRFAPEELTDAELVPPSPFTKGAPVLRLPGRSWGNPYAFGTLLFDLRTDPGQQNPLVDDELELRMANRLVELMRTADAPESQFERLGLPAAGPVTDDHLLVRAQRELAAASQQELPDATEFASDAPNVTAPVRDLLGAERTREVVVRHLPMLSNPEFAERVAGLSPWQLAFMTPGLSVDALRSLNEELAG